jgi:hypothetical protein
VSPKINRGFIVCGAEESFARSSRDPWTLPIYGLTPDREHRPLTVEEEALKVAKAKATRAARHTMGKRQKEAIKGQVPPKPAP